MELNALVDEADILLPRETDVERPGEAHQARDLEYLRTERLCQTQLLVLELDFELSHGLLQVYLLFVVAQRDAERVEDHRQDVEVPAESHGQVEGEPDDDARVDPNPQHRHEERDRVQVLPTAIFLPHRIRNRKPLQVSQGDQQDVDNLSAN